MVCCFVSPFSSSSALSSSVVSLLAVLGDEFGKLARIWATSAFVSVGAKESRGRWRAEGGDEGTDSSGRLDMFGVV